MILKMILLFGKMEERICLLVYIGNIIVKKKGIIFLFHGLNGHGYSPVSKSFSRQFAKQGFIVFVLDQHGHGRTATENNRGEIKDWKYLIDDGYKFIDYIMNRLVDFNIEEDLKFFCSRNFNGRLCGITCEFTSPRI